MTEDKSFNKLNNNLHNEIALLWDKCFSDLPIVKQRLLKAYGIMSSKKAYTHRPKQPVTIAKLQKIGKLKIYENDRHFSPTDEQTKQAQKLANKIIKNMINGNNQTSQYLKDFLKDKKVVIGVEKVLSDDAGYDGYNPLTKEIYIDLCAGVFHNQKKYPEFFNEDTLAKTIGHELGHAVEQTNRGHKTHPNYVGYSSNSWEVESFCDAFGCALCKGAGYNLSPSIEKLKLFEEQDLIRHREEDPHPTYKQRRQLVELIDKAYPKTSSTIRPYPPSITALSWDDKETSKNKSLLTEPEKSHS